MTDRRLASPWVWGALGLAAALGMLALGLRQYLIFHSLVELFTIVVAVSIFVIGFNTRHLIENGALELIAASSLFIAGLDLVHTLAYKGMGVFQGYDANLPTQLWVAARYLQALSLLMAGYCIGSRLRWRLALVGYSLVTIAILLSLFAWPVFPACFIEGQGLTPFKKISEYIISAMLAGAAALFWRKRQRFDRGLLYSLLGALGVSILAELAFTLYVGVYTTWNVVGHLLRLGATFLFYRALILVGLRRPYVLLFRELKESEDSLRASEERYRTLADFTYDWETWSGVDGRFIYVSPSVERITGHLAEAFYRDSGLVAVITHPEDRERVAAHLAAVGPRRDREEMTFRILRRDGEERWISHVCQPVFDAEGHWAGMRASNRDITLAMQTQQEREALIARLEQSLAQVRQLSGMIPICSSCKKVRTDAGYWQAVEVYVRDHSEAEFTHGLCPECIARLYPEYAEMEDEEKGGLDP